ncbi:hypothetical protein [Streptomyces sp. NPDC054834]
MLPVVESVNSAPAVNVFTSGEQLFRAFPQVPCYRPGTLRQLAAHWPTGEVVLVIDAGHEDSRRCPHTGRSGFSRAASSDVR